MPLISPRATTTTRRTHDTRRCLHADLLTQPVVTLQGDDIAEVRDVVYDSEHGKLLGFTSNKRVFFGGKSATTPDGIGPRNRQRRGHEVLLTTTSSTRRTHPTRSPLLLLIATSSATQSSPRAAPSSVRSPTSSLPSAKTHAPSATKSRPRLAPSTSRFPSNTPYQVPRSSCLTRWTASSMTTSPDSVPPSPTTADNSRKGARQPGERRRRQQLGGLLQSRSSRSTPPIRC